MTLEALSLPSKSDVVAVGRIARNILAAPFIYGLALPLAVLDAAVSLYQVVCFRLWRIGQVRRRDHVSFARAELPYLNPMQKMNCGYCAYANGVLAYAREIAARTEQYWCPIKHVAPPAAPHHRYESFIPYGEVISLEARWEARREALKAPPRSGNP
ncbi:hypothetical protein Q0812_08465 [Brevundimonas sp. 2R-24]|uniref:Uncharacterized protein n=1 Tax=Peiella sedimenti TaxID=3061083 RepID=A0ABT8SND5_9CAUL|nr:hypothetical protein [Caulobacteraceae bacterium XZ-24]